MLSVGPPQNWLKADDHDRFLSLSSTFITVDEKRDCTMGAVPQVKSFHMHVFPPEGLEHDFRLAELLSFEAPQHKEATVHPMLKTHSEPATQVQRWPRSYFQLLAPGEGASFQKGLNRSHWHWQSLSLSVDELGQVTTSIGEVFVELCTVGNL